MDQCSVLSENANQWDFLGNTLHHRQGGKICRVKKIHKNFAYSSKFRTVRRHKNMFNFTFFLFVLLKEKEHKRKEEIIKC